MKLLLVLAPLAAPAAQESDAPEVGLAEAVRPVLLRCIECHGADEQESELRLDSRESALEGGYSGPALVPGDPEASELVYRVETGEALDVMPPPEEVPLTSEEKGLVRRWVSAGAPWPDLTEPAPTHGELTDFARTILRENCIECHGVDRKRSGLRLDGRDAALQGGYSGPAFVPGSARESELFRRITSSDAEERMPFERAPLAPGDIEALRRWLDSGAAWPDGLSEPSAAVSDDVHWAYLPLDRRPPPEPPLGHDGRNAVDRFVLAKLGENGLAPSPEARPHTLLRRLHQDLVGLPPTESELFDFLEAHASDPEGAFERKVDELLASPHFGERWARHWLDRARYADSDGYEKDNPRRRAYLYRDWVIEAINEDLPYDEFTIRQLAGDLLPDASWEEHVATAFHRQTLTNREGGIDEEEFRVSAVLDRVDTTGSVWLGLTVGCAQCHDHKFDRFSQREYYQLYAFFNNADEVEHPVPPLENALERFEQERSVWTAERGDVEGELAEAALSAEPELQRWLARMRAEHGSADHAHAPTAPLAFEVRSSKVEGSLQPLPDGSILNAGPPRHLERYSLQGLCDVERITGFQLEPRRHASLPDRGPGRAPGGDFALNSFRVWATDTPDKDGVQPLELAYVRRDGREPEQPAALAIDGDVKTAYVPGPGRPNQLRFYLAEPLVRDEPFYLSFFLGMTSGDFRTLGRFRLTALVDDDPWGDVPEGVREPLTAVLASAEGAADIEELRTAYLREFPPTDEIVARLAALEAQAPETPTLTAAVLAERSAERRPDHVLLKGDFLRPGARVSPEVPATLPPLRARDGQEADRLDLARWLVSGENPLPPRVAVNQIWERIFGRGIVSTVDNFGVRGELPSHPRLLDWLAAELVRVGWSRKALIKTIVTSTAYRRASAHREDLVEIDPENRLLARQNRRRLDAELVRDHFLSAAGLLSTRVGGPSVFPPLPDGVADQSYAFHFRWDVSRGGDRYRRGLYTFFKRTAPHPNLLAFDCPTASKSAASRRVSNTPLQALTTLNNEVFHEAAQGLAAYVLERAATDEERIGLAFGRCVSRTPDDAELERLEDYLAIARAWYRDRPEDAAELAGAHRPDGVPASEAAAWVATARLVLNLDESLTRE